MCPDNYPTLLITHLSQPYMGTSMAANDELLQVPHQCSQSVGWISC